jgi:hypothetical protein
VPRAKKDLTIMIAASSMSGRSGIGSHCSRMTILRLVAVKKQTREMGEGVPPAELTEFLSASLARYSDFSGKLRHDVERDKSMQRLADHFYLDEVCRVKP